MRKKRKNAVRVGRFSLRAGRADSDKRAIWPRERKKRHFRAVPQFMALIGVIDGPRGASMPALTLVEVLKLRSRSVREMQRRTFKFLPMIVGIAYPNTPINPQADL